MATEAIKTRTEGRMLFKKTGDKRLADAGKMPIDQLEALIAEIKSGKAPKAAKAADPNGAKKKTTATKAVAEAAAPVKAKKTTPAAKPAAKATEAKTRPVKAVAPVPKAKTAPKAEAKPAKAAKSTPKAEQPKKAPKAAAPVQGIARLDNASIDWTRESPVGTTGKRKQVLDLLRKFEGDKSKVFAKLESYATDFYPDKDEAAAKKMLTWLIGRVAFDFASKSGQHVSGSRTWTFTTKAVPAVKAKKAASPARKPASPQEPAQKATRAPKKASKRA